MKQFSYEFPHPPTPLPKSLFFSYQNLDFGQILLGDNFLGGSTYSWRMWAPKSGMFCEKVKQILPDVSDDAYPT